MLFIRFAFKSENYVILPEMTFFLDKFNNCFLYQNGIGKSNSKEKIIDPPSLGYLLFKMHSGKILTALFLRLLGDTVNATSPFILKYLDFIYIYLSYMTK